MKTKRKLAPSKYLRRYGKAKTTPVITKEEVEAVLECEITDERYEELLEASRTYSLSNSDKHVNLAQDAEHRQDWEGAKKHWKNAALASIKHDAHKGTNRSDKLKVRGITMRKEEVEQIDETNKTDLTNHDNFHKHIKREIAISQKMKERHGPNWQYLKGRAARAVQASYKIVQNEVDTNKEEVEQIDELSSETKKSYTKKAKADVELLSKAVKWHKDSSRPSQYKNKSADKFLIAKHTKKINKRNKGISQANEEVEQIDELSNEKKAQYIKRSKQSRESHHIHADHYADRGASGKKGFFKHMDKASKRLKGIATAKASMKVEAVELSSSRKTKVNALLAKHQAKGLPSKPSKKYTREYTGDGLPLIAAVINQEETINESRSDRRERPKHVDSNSKRSAGYPPKNKVTKQITNSKERAAKKEYIRKAMDESITTKE